MATSWLDNAANLFGIKDGFEHHQKLIAFQRTFNF
jgi:hypothetical protein